MTPKNFNPIPTEKQVTRFWEQVRKTDTCWLWTGLRTPKGYGMVRLGSSRLNAPRIGTHRLSYIIHFGAIPQGKLVCHTCDNPSCVRPTHLFAGSYLENLLDAFKKGRRKSVGHYAQTHPEIVTGERNPAAKLTETDVREIRSSCNKGLHNHSELATRFGVSYSIVWRICRRLNWKHLA